MRARGPLLLIVLALGAVCFLFWDDVLAPIFDSEAAGEANSLLGPDDLAAVDGDASDDGIPPAEPEEYWTGPKVELAYRNFRLEDFQGGGAVNAIAFSGFFPTGYFRGGGGIDAGVRSYTYGRAGALLGAHLFAGYQHLKDLGRVLPFIQLVGQAGVVLGKRFQTSVSYTTIGWGVEMGADVTLVRTLYLGLGLGYMHYRLDELGYDTFAVRISLGL